MSDYSDDAVIARVLAGDADAFEEIIKRYNDKLFRYVYSKVNNYDEAADVTQDIFVMAYESLASFRGESKFYTWLFSITINYCKNHQKKSRRQASVSINRPDDTEFEMQIHDERVDIEAGVIDRDSLRIVKEELFKLPDDYREILVLRDIEGYSYNNISSMLSINLANVKVRIHRGREMLKKRLSERGLLS
ncbi:MAG TPA: sigma-70 family RNA polymerase sigma factor [Spirochaetota bacterium]|nr:sigma-70 family RNA polymerase sigma factor [Spirochaetota bacterium]